MGGDGHLEPVHAMAGDGLVHEEGTDLRKFPRHARQGQVALLHGPGLELRLEMGLGLGILGHGQAARGVAVQPMHQAWPKGRDGVFLRLFLAGGGEVPGLSLHAAQQGVRDRAESMAGSRVDHHARGLVDDPKTVVLEECRQLDDFRFQMDAWRDDFRQLCFDQVSRP